jgi:hypothetical protein
MGSCWLGNVSGGLEMESCSGSVEGKQGCHVGSMVGMFGVIA